MRFLKLWESLVPNWQLHVSKQHVKWFSHYDWLYQPISFTVRLSLLLLGRVSHHMNKIWRQPNKESVGGRNVTQSMVNVYVTGNFWPQPHCATNLTKTQIERIIRPVTLTDVFVTVAELRRNGDLASEWTWNSLTSWLDCRAWQLTRDRSFLHYTH